MPDIERKPNSQSVEGTIDVAPFNGDFAGKDIVSVEQFTRRDELDAVFSLADKMKMRVEKKVAGTELKDSTVSLLFYQPSTRTYTSFYSAARWLGCHRIMGIHEMADYSSAAKGESLPDTIRSIIQTTATDAIILRHPSDDSSEIAAKYSPVPIFNAGSGRREHPTQGVLDLYTIREELGRTQDLEVTMTGDLLNGRTIKSLAKLLTLAGEGMTFNFIAPGVLQMPDEVTEYLTKRGAKVRLGENSELDATLATTDVLYVTRIQKEWFTLQAAEELRQRMGDRLDGVDGKKIKELAEQMGESSYKKAVEGYVIDAERMKYAKQDMIVMHPLPRVTEVSTDFDEDPRAAYFREMRYGLYTRMAELALVLGKLPT